MRKAISLLLLFALLCGVSACAGEPSGNGETSSAAAAHATAEETSLPRETALPETASESDNNTEGNVLVAFSPALAQQSGLQPTFHKDRRPVFMKSRRKSRIPARTCTMETLSHERRRSTTTLRQDPAYQGLLMEWSNTTWFSSATRFGTGKRPRSSVLSWKAMI